jgi:CheY-like chemotaxis protein
LARKILLADDSVTAQNMGRKILADAGYEIIAVNNGSAALKKIAETKPDLVILDVYMPGYSGLEVCQRMKESPETARIPVLLTVGKLEPFKPEEAQRVRAEGYIVKPFEASELLSALSKLEDKVVPRSEGSRPGRFARAIAAVEDAGRGEDNGWKNRIAFPHEKSEDEQKSAEENSGDQSDGYNPVNRDLRTVVETRQELAEEKREQVRQEEAKQAQSKQSQEEAQRQEARREDAKLEETKLEEAKLEEIKREQARREEDERQHASEASAQASVDISALAASGATSSALPTDVTEEEVAAITAAAAQMQMASAATQEEAKVDAKTEATTRSEESPRDIPVTIAANADSVAGSGSGTPRWTAVAVTLEGEEASVSLDQEMQKAYASAQAAVIEAAPPEPAASPEISSQPAAFEPVAPAAELATPSVESAQPGRVPQPEAAEAEPAAMAEAAVPAWQSEPQETSAISETATVASHTEETAAAGIAADLSDFATAASNISEIPSPATAQLEPAAESQLVSQQAESEPVTAPQPPGDSKDVKSTAAAWASWRQTRDTKTFDAPSPGSQSAEPASLAADTAPETNAAAVAAGAEQILRAVAGADTSSENSNSSHDVASIVDSVLADLRPKLMEEISRKMASKK